MILSDISVKRPVFATVISLLLVAFGLISFDRLPLRELPDVDAPIVSIGTDYRGASAAVVESRVTQVIEDRIAGIAGIKTITSRSRDGSSDITIEFGLDRDIDAAANDVRNAVSRVLDNLPEEADPPEVAKVDSDDDVIVWFNLASTTMNNLELTDFAERFVVDRLSTVDGVARVRVGGQQSYSVRIWLDRAALAARALTIADIEAALRRDNVELPGGRLESRDTNLTVRVERGFVDVEDFRNLSLGQGEDGHVITLGEVARVEIGAANPDADFRGNREMQVGLGISKQSQANTIEVVQNARAEIERIRKTLPQGTMIYDSYDSSVYIQAAIDEVFFTLFITGLLVIAVIYLFLGDARAALVPAVTVPVCITGAFIALYAFGLTINLMTLLALVLAIGLVVDDAIVVLENIQRRIQEGEPRLVAAYRGARQVGFAVIATTTVLVAVFAPITFLTGDVGQVFAELAVAMACAVALSSLVALTLSPMMCSKILRESGGTPGRASRIVIGATDRLARAYRAALALALEMPRTIIAVFLLVTAAAVVLFRLVPAELVPDEDRGAFFVAVRGPESASFDYMLPQMRMIEDRLMTLHERGEAPRVLVRTGGWGGGESNSGFAIVVLSDWSDREREQAAIISEMRRSLAEVPGVRAFIFSRGGLGGGQGQPLQYVLQGPDYETLAEWRDIVLARAAENPNIVGLDSDLEETSPQLRVEIDRTRAADLGVSVQAIGRTLETLLASRRVTTYVQGGEEYDVILQARDEDRENANDLANIFVRSDRTGELIPLSNLVTTREEAAPGSLNRFNRLRAVTLSGNLAPGYTLAEAIEYLDRVVADALPETAQTDLRGQSREYLEASNELFFIFALALLVVFLVLAAQFESWVHPLVIILTVPLAVAGGLYGLFMIGSTLNVYSQIGIVMLVGLAAKNGILIVEFANQLRDEGRVFREALIEACVIRLRPILMTSISTAAGALPLVLADGPGEASRQTIGIVIFSGVLFATLLTLFITPVFYDLLARRTRSPEAVARDLAAEERRLGGARQPAGGGD